MIKAIQGPKSFVEHLAIDPWNRSMFLAVAVADVLVSIRFGWFGGPGLTRFAGAFAPVTSIGGRARGKVVGSPDCDLVT